MSVRQDQDVLLVTITPAGNVRQQQESLLITTKQNVTAAHVRMQQCALLILAPPISCTRTQLINGAFQDSEGNVLANGYITLELSQDAQSCFGQVGSGIRVKVPLDINGNIQGTTSGTTYLVWGNDKLTPSTTFYVVRGYTSVGQLSWGPRNETVTTGSGTFDCNTWTG